MSLTFGKSQYFPALQAADMVSFLVRREASARFYVKQVTDPGTGRESSVPVRENEFKRLVDYLLTDAKPQDGIMRWFTLFATEQKFVDIANELLNEMKTGMPKV